MTGPSPFDTLIARQLGEEWLRQERCPKAVDLYSRFVFYALI